MHRVWYFKLKVKKSGTESIVKLLSGGRRIGSPRGGGDGGDGDGGGGGGEEYVMMWDREKKLDRVFGSGI
jgi:hypothetical protein